MVEGNSQLMKPMQDLVVVPEYSSESILIRSNRSLTKTGLYFIPSYTRRNNQGLFFIAHVTSVTSQNSSSNKIPNQTSENTNWDQLNFLWPETTQSSSKNPLKIYQKSPYDNLPYNWVFPNAASRQLFYQGSQSKSSKTCPLRLTKHAKRNGDATLINCRGFVGKSTKTHDFFGRKFLPWNKMAGFSWWFSWICLVDAWNKFQTYSHKWWWKMVIYIGRIQKKSPKNKSKQLKGLMSSLSTGRFGTIISPVLMGDETEIPTISTSTDVEC